MRKSRAIKVPSESAKDEEVESSARLISAFKEKGMSVQQLSISQIKPNSRNVRTHSAKQIRQIADSIIAFGFTSPVLVSEDGELIAGHGRCAAAKQLGLDKIPAVIVAELSPAKRRALAIADNKIAQNAKWDRERLAIEIPELADLLNAEGLDVAVLGFEPAEVDHIQTDLEHHAANPQDRIDPKWGEAVAVSMPGDLWLLGDHKLLCGDARCTADVARLMAGCRADLAFLDPQCGKDTEHCESALANRDMSSPDFVGFLSSTLNAAAAVSRSGALHFVCMDWGHIVELMAAAEPIYGRAIDVAVWEQPKAGPASLYRGQLEFIGVFGVGKAPRLEIPPGRHKRSRSNVWHYAAVNGAMDALHPTAKPVALVADAIKDGTRKGDVVLDIFAGPGTTIMAAQRVGRQARALEVEPRLVDVAIRRWQAGTRRDAVHAESGLSFDETAARSGHAIAPNGDQGERK
jgi:DNA methylase/ParB-like nuclease domain